MLVLLLLVNLARRYNHVSCNMEEKKLVEGKGPEDAEELNGQARSYKEMTIRMTKERMYWFVCYDSMIIVQGWFMSGQ